MHRTSSLYIILILLLVITSCIEPYSLNIGGQSSSKYVVYGQVTDQEGYQTVSISMSSTLDAPDYSPLANCDVKIIDTIGNIFELDEFEKGNYRVWIEKKFLNPGNSYKVNIITPSGVEIVSDYDKMPEGPEIDSIYHIREDIPTNNPDNPIQGIQFYIDLDGKNTDSRFYKWELVETWEHHAAYPKTYYWNSLAIIRVNPPDFSKFYCWSTLPVKSIFSVSTKDFVQNRVKMQKLHFVDNQTQRLTFCYSLLINQFAISEPAYNYWEKLRNNSSDRGGLYDTQPLRFKGNLISITNPDQEVLGFFSASSVRSKRIFVQNVDNLELYYFQCEGRPRNPTDFKKGRTQYMIYENGALLIVEDQCIECNIYGIGKTDKPDFWPY